MAKYKVKPGFEDKVVCTSKPLDRTSGRFILKNCTQKELKYLHDVVKYKGVIIESDGKESDKE